ncbi:kinase-like domain-containing protein [Aspergillus heterothallicus]
MSGFFRALRNNIRQQRPPKRHISGATQIIPADTLIEEETLPHYQPAHYYSVNIGDVYLSRYKIAGKLGYGAYSTSWLCQDLRANNKYIVLKVSTCLPDFPTATERELRIYEHLSKIESSHPGQALIRGMYYSFDMHSTGGKHQCLVLQPMQMRVLEMLGTNPKPFDMPLLKMTVRRLLLVLDFLHTEAGVIHADLKTDNLMLSLEDDDMLGDFATSEAEDPSPRKPINESRIIYKSRKFRRPRESKGYGLPVLCDFGEARIGDRQESGPFVIFEMPWGSPVDIWNLGALVWDLFEGEQLFGDIFNARGRHDAFKHLALTVALIGPRSSEFVRRSETTEQCFDSGGAWIAHEEEPIPKISLEMLEKRLGREEKTLFLAFIKSMLMWIPEERHTAKQLLKHPFLL